MLRCFNIYINSFSWKTPCKVITFLFPFLAAAGLVNSKYHVLVELSPHLDESLAQCGNESFPH